MIEVEDLTKYYGPHRAIHEVSFSVDRGEIVAFLGPNGAGKTTTMRILTGFMPASAGTASVAGYDVYSHSVEARRHIGYVPENPALYEDMRVNQYLAFCGRLEGLSSAAIGESIDRVIETCGLTERYDQIIGRLSMGFRQRVCLAQALLHDPDVLILDEPTLGLDPNQIRQVRDLIRSLGGDHTIMLSTHILPEAQAVAERVIIINHGEIVAVDTPEALMSQLRDSQTILLKLQKTDDASMDRLQELAWVDGVTTVPEDNQSFYIDTSAGTDDARADLAEFVVKQGWGLLELRAIEMSLEDVFRQLTTEEKGVA
ncbi:MAG: ABC transporter ATP-binding protein [Armatimonadota bacterium]